MPLYTVSYDDIHHQIKNSMDLAEAYSEFKYLSKILGSCRMKPFNFIHSKKSNLLQLHTYWIDEYINSLKIFKKENFKNPSNISIICNDLFIEKEKIISTDIYHGLSINKIAKMSTCFLFLESLNEYKTYYISFLGLDKYIRTFKYEDSWIQVSSLLIGLNNLRDLVKGIPKEKVYYKNKTLPCEIETTMLYYMPIDSDAIDKIEKLSGLNLQFLKGNK